jgi:hypothetical protein
VDKKDGKGRGYRSFFRGRRYILCGTIFIERLKIEEKIDENR